MDLDIRNLVFLQPIIGATINRVELAPKFRTLLYLIMSLSLCSATIVFLARYSLGVPLRKSVVVAFFLSGLIYAVQGELIWASWLVTDAKAYAGLTTHEKLMRSEDGGLYAFAHSARSVIRGDYMLYSSNSTLAAHAEYFLLPLRKRERAAYIVVLEDWAAVYDQADRTFMRGAVKINNLEPIYQYSSNAYVLRRAP